MTLERSQEHRNEDLRHAVSESRDLEIDGLRLRILRNVFPPDLGYSSILMARSLASLNLGRRALDLGTGSLYLALTLRRLGVPSVFATDKSEQAVRCAIINLTLNPSLAPIEIACGDLFTPLTGAAQFDTIVFNQPFYPITDGDIAGMGADGGKEITTRFLVEAPGRLTSRGFVLMSVSTIAAEEDSPAQVARRLGWLIEERGAVDANGVRSRVVRLWPPA
jgi:release factor glutamine methyltransferase